MPRPSAHALPCIVTLACVLTTPWAVLAAVDTPPAPDLAAPEDALNMSSTFTGTFVSYAEDRQEMTVTDENGEELVLTVDADVVPRAAGRTLTFAALHPGDQLHLTVVDEEDGAERITAIDVVPAPAHSASE